VYFRGIGIRFRGQLKVWTRVHARCILVSFDLSQRKLLYTVNNFGGLSNCAPRVDLDLQSSILVLVEMMVMLLLARGE
jgi:hypothetical protein